MSRKQLVDMVAAVANVQPKQASLMVDAVVMAASAMLKDGQDVRIKGFGSFSVRDVAARTARNPKTGEPIEVAAGRKVAFKASKDLV